jgi:hypothetical protein
MSCSSASASPECLVSQVPESVRRCLDASLLGVVLDDLLHSAGRELPASPGLEQPAIARVGGYVGSQGRGEMANIGRLPACDDEWLCIEPGDVAEYGLLGTIETLADDKQKKPCIKTPPFGK